MLKPQIVQFQEKTLIAVRGGRLKARNIFFAEKPSLANALGFITYTSCASIAEKPFFIRADANTKTIDLRRNEAEIFGNFNATTKYEIKRSTRDGTVCQAEEDFDRFFAFHNEFARSKRLPFSSDYILLYKDHLAITKSLLGEEILCMHSYLTDSDIGRATLLTSSSLFRLHNNTQKRNLIGRANRNLHYRDMLMFKELGYTTYDLGGYALDTADADLQSINKFKDDFGGQLLRESNYFSYPRIILDHFKKLVSRRKRNGQSPE